MRSLTTGGGVAILAGVLAIGVAGAAAWMGVEPSQVRVIVVAAAVAGGGAIAGWCLARQGRGKAPGLAVAGGLGATLVRLFPVLVAMGWIMSRPEGVGPERADVLLVFFYLLMLATDVLLNMIGASEPAHGRRSTTSN